jgi:hypothetical protein
MGGKYTGVASAGNRYSAFFENLSQRLKGTPFEFCEFIQKENTPMGERDFSGYRWVSASQKSGSSCTVVWRSEGSFHTQGLILPILIGDTAHERALESMFKRHRRKQ